MKSLRFKKAKNMLKSIIGFIFLLIFSSQSATAQDEDVMLQAFDWNVHIQPAGSTWLQVLSNNNQRIADAGFDMVWLPPTSDSAAPQGYLPRELFNFNSAYGTEQQLRTLINQFHSNDVKVIGDIVINHRVGSPDAVTFVNPNWPTFFITADDEGRNFVNGPVNFSINSDYVPGFALKADGSNGTFAAARDLDHFNPQVRQEITAWMNFLRNDLGYDGWRYDFVHGYDPIYNKEYNDATQPYFAVGELLESSRVQINNWVNFTQQSSSAFDFNLKVSLQNAFRANNLSFLRDFEGNASGLVGINPSKSVTFLENHDTGVAQQCCGPNFIFPGGETNLGKGYAYILTHPGVPMVFWTHYFNESQGFRDTIDGLIETRKRVRIFAGSSMNIAEARNDLYAAYIDGRDGTIAMKLGSGNWSPDGNGWVLRNSGTDYAVWTQGGSDNQVVDNEEEEEVNNGTPFTVFVQGFTNAYTFGSTPDTSGAWPGLQLTALGNDWYSGVVPGDCTNIIFNNNGSNQTDDLNVCNTAPYYANGQFVANPPSDFPSDNNNQDTDDNSPFTVFVEGFTNAYTFANNQDTSGAWPGLQLTALGNNWYSGQIPGDCTNIVFNNNGSGQSPDLNVCSNAPYYTNGQFVSTPPSSFPGNDATFTIFVRGFTNTYTFANNQDTSGPWPGIQATSIGNNWYRTEVPGPCTNIIFNNNGSNQTADLNACNTAPYYANGQFLSNPPSDFPSGSLKSITANNAPKANVYPNPFVNQFEVTLSASITGTVVFELVNSLGQIITSQKEDASSTDSFNVILSNASITSGLYFYQISQENEILTTGKLLKK